MCNKKENSANEKCYKVPGQKFLFLFFKKSWLLLENTANHKRHCLPWVSGDFQYLEWNTVHCAFGILVERSLSLFPAHSPQLLTAATAKLSPRANCRNSDVPKLSCDLVREFKSKMFHKYTFFKLWILQRTKKCTNYSYFFFYNAIRFCKTLG